MAVTLVRCKVVRPFALWGRYVGSAERLHLHPADFERFQESGHVVRIDDDAAAVLVLQPARWTQPVER